VNLKSKFFDFFINFFLILEFVRMIAEEENKRGGQSTDVISVVSFLLDYFS